MATTPSTLKPKPQPQLTPSQIEAALQVADDCGRVANAFPPAEVWQREFPNDYHEDAEGRFRVDYRHQGNTVEQNERNSAKAMALISNWQAVAYETSMARDARVPTVRVRGMDGVTMNIPASQEANASRKGKVKPVIRYGRATRYWTDPQGVKWKRRHGQDWERDE